MANSTTKVGQFTDEIEQATKEAGGEVKDAVGEMIEQNVKTTFGPQLTPQQIQQKQVEDQKKLVEARRKIAWFKDLSVAQKKIREQEKQKVQQKQQFEEQEKQKKKMEEDQKKQVIISPAKRKPQVPGQQAPVEEIARTRQEIGKGHGVGG